MAATIHFLPEKVLPEKEPRALGHSGQFALSVRRGVIARRFAAALLLAFACAGCAGSGGGSTASCSASRGYTVTPSAGANGSISPSTAQVVAYNATPAFTLSANVGYTASASGCGGSLSVGSPRK